MNARFQPNALLTMLFPWRKTRLVEQAGGEVARECRADLWQHIRFRAACMSAPEIRGYARAHAAVIASDHVDQVLERRLLKSTLRAQVLASGVEQLVGMAVHDALSEETLVIARPMAA